VEETILYQKPIPIECEPAEGGRGNLFRLLPFACNGKKVDRGLEGVSNVMELSINLTIPSLSPILLNKSKRRFLWLLEVLQGDCP
jgi:hypothetical protein